MSDPLKMLSVADLEALSIGDMSKVSEQGLRMLAGDSKKDYQAGRNADGWKRGLASVMNGPMMGFADEIGGAVGGAIDTVKSGGSFSQNYRSNRDTLRGMQDAEKDANPITTGITQLMASAPMMVGNVVGNAAARVVPKVADYLNKTRTGAGALAARSAQAGGNAAAYGGVSGLGGSTAEDASGMAWDAAKGAAVSGALGAATPGASQVAMGGYNQIATRVSESAAINHARQKVAEALSRDARGELFETGASNAGQQAAARFARLGPEARVVDAGGQNTRQLLDTTATLPGRTKNLVENAIHDRQAGRAERLTAAADGAMNIGGKRMSSSIDGWIAKREMEASPLYAKLRETSITPSDGLKDIVAAAEKLGAGSVAKKIATAKQLPYTLNAGGEPGSTLLNVPKTSAWSMRDLDLLKQGLDDIIARTADDTGKLTPYGASVTQLNASLKKELDQLTMQPDGTSLYQTARQTFAGPSALIDASKKGKTSFMQDETSIRQAMDGMAGSELEAFRLGAFEALRGKLGKMSGQTEILNMWRDRATREKLQAVFGDERSFRTFAVSAGREARLKGLESVGRGSQTAARQYGAGDLDVTPMLQAATAVTQGNPTGLLSAAAGAWNRVKTPEPVRDQIGSLLLSRNPNVMQELGLLTPLLTADRNRRASMAGRFEGLLVGQ